MKQPEIQISAGAAFLAAAGVLLLSWEELGALLLAVLAHELGHLAAILLLGLRPTAFRAGPEGLLITYEGESGAAGHALIAAAGPAAGLVFAWAASRLGTHTGWNWLCLSAGISLLLSLFNLLPALPLDGGHLLRTLGSALLGPQKGARLAQTVQLISAVLLSGAGAILLLRGRGAAVLTAGLILLRTALSETGAVLQAGS